MSLFPVIWLIPLMPISEGRSSAVDYFWMKTPSCGVGIVPLQAMKCRAPASA